MHQAISALDVRSISDSTKSTTLHEAVINGHTGIVRLLIEYGVDINSKDIYGHTALRQAILRADASMVNTLLSDRKIVVNDVDLNFAKEKVEAYRQLLKLNWVNKDKLAKKEIENHAADAEIIVSLISDYFLHERV